MFNALSLLLVFSSAAGSCYGGQEWLPDFSDPVVFKANKDDCYVKTCEYLSENNDCNEILIAINEDRILEGEQLIKSGGCAFEKSPLERDRMGNGIYVVNISRLFGRDLYDFLKRLMSADFISYFEPRYLGALYDTTPNDCYISFPTMAYWYDQISLRKAWDISTGHTSVKIGLIDTGINGNHQDFWANSNSILSHTFSEEEANNDVDSLNALYDPQGHGSRTGGIIAGYGNNNIAMAGVSWHADLISLKLNTVSGNETPDTVAAALNYAEEHNIKICNFSGGFFNCEPQILVNAINNYSGLLVVAAGNIEGPYSPANGDHVFPASYTGGNFANVISVGASNSGNQVASFSWYGQNSVNIFAPGETIYGPSKISTTGTTSGSGSSYSAPLVTGTAALMSAVNPSLTPSQIKSQILLTGDTLSGFVGQCSTGAQLNAYQALLSSIPSKTVLQPSFSCTRPIGGFEDHHWYKLDVPYPGTYTVSSSGSLSLDGELYSNIQNAPLKTAAAGTGPGTYPVANFSMNYHFSAPGTYYLHVKRNGGYAGTYSIISNFVAG